MKKLLLTLLLVITSISLFSQADVYGSKKRFEKLIGTYVFEGDTVLQISKDKLYFEEKEYVIDAVFMKFTQAQFLLNNENGVHIGSFWIYGRWNHRYIQILDEEGELRLYTTDLKALKQ